MRLLMDKKGETTDDSDPTSAIYWIHALCNGTVEAFIQQVLKIPKITELGTRHLCADMGKHSFL